MYARIAVGNVRKSLRDFSVFFVTLAIGVCVFYAFGSITDQAAVVELNEDSRTLVQWLSGMLNGVSSFFVVILGALVVYANRFIIRRRRREFGIYLTLGMPASRVSLIVVLEGLLVGIGSLVCGLALGVALSQVMMYVTASLFEATVDGFVFVFSVGSCLRTLVCFAVVFLVSLLLNVRSVARWRLVDLIDADRVSERERTRSLPVCVVLFVVSLVLIGVAYAVLTEHGMASEGPWFGIATALVAVGTLLFFFSGSGFLLRLVQACKGLYLRGLNMFVLRQVSSRINTAWLSISFVCAMLFLAICATCTGFSVTMGLNRSVAEGTPYDASLTSFPSGIAAEGWAADGVQAAADGYDMVGALRREVPGWDDYVGRAVQVDTYGDRVMEPGYVPQLTMAHFLDATDFEGGATTDVMLEYSRDAAIPFVPLSQYNALREMAGEDPVELAEGECLVWNDMAALDDFWRAVAAQGGPFEAWGHELAFAEDGVVGVHLQDTTTGSTITGALVVNDEVIPDYERPSMSVVNVDYAGPRDEVDPAFTDALREGLVDDLARTDGDAWPAYSYVTAQELLGEMGGTTLVISYLAIYIGFALLVGCSAVLAIQQLSQAADNVSRYRVLAELGAERSMVSRALLMQVGVYFLFPLVVAVAHAAVALASVNDIVLIMTGFDISQSLVVTVGVVVLLYGSYFLVTYVTSKTVILRPAART